jgi:CysZ protein
MSFLRGISYQFRGLRVALRSPRLLALGLLRFAVIILITIASAGIALVYHQEITELVWIKPQSAWITWLWHVVSWLVALLLVGVSAIVSFLISQIVFSVVIMDAMSRITEKMALPTAPDAPAGPLLKQFLYLVRQEIPRNTLPVLLTLVIMIIGWSTPLGPIVTVLSSAAAIVFLAWDNTDLVPARRLEPFSTRFGFLIRNIGFHLGFGLVFLIPGLNIVFLSFAPVGATLWYIEKDSRPSAG